MSVYTNPDGPAPLPNVPPPSTGVPVGGGTPGGPYTPSPNTANPNPGAGSLGSGPPASNAFDYLRDLLDAYGLGSLSDWLRQQVIDGTVDDEASFTQALRERDEYKQRFRGLEERRSRGLNAISVNEYLAYERQAAQMLRAAGMPPGFYDSTDDFADFIGKDVSIVELQQRLDAATAAAHQAPVEARQALRDLYGVEDEVGAIAAFFLDEDRGLQAVTNQWRSAQVAGSSRRVGFGDLSADEAERLASVAEPEQAEQALSALAQAREVTGALAGETDAMTRERQLAVAEGDTEALTEFEQRRRRRTGGFEGGGGFASGQGGYGGLGSSNR